MNQFRTKSFLGNYKHWTRNLTTADLKTADLKTADLKTADLTTADLGPRTQVLELCLRLCLVRRLFQTIV